MANKGLLEAITEIQRLVATVNGVRAAPIYPPDQMNQFPYAICYPDLATITSGTGGPGAIHGLHQIALEIHVPYKDKPRDMGVIIPIGVDVFKLLYAEANAYLAGAIDTFISIDYDFGPLGYDNVNTIGWRFLINVKIDEVL